VELEYGQVEKIWSGVWALGRPRARTAGRLARRQHCAGGSPWPYRAPC